MLRNVTPITIMIAIAAVAINYAAFFILTSEGNPFEWSVEIVEYYFTSCTTTVVVSVFTYMLTYQIIEMIKKHKL